MLEILKNEFLETYSTPIQRVMLSMIKSALNASRNFLLDAFTNVCVYITSMYIDLPMFVWELNTDILIYTIVGTIADDTIIILF